MPPEKRAPREGAPRILVVDNERRQRDAMREQLSWEGFHVEVAEGAGGSALWLAQTFRPWVVIASHDLPSTDGLEVLSLLRADAETAHVPLLLLGPSDDEAFVVRALEEGANAVVGRGLSPAVLLAHVYAQLNVFQMVMELREKNQYLRDLVVRDPMTGVFNHAHLHELVDREVARSLRLRTPLSFLIVDLDHFKAVNDEHGHLAGDYYLKAASQALTQGGRRSDSVARYGGDEFCLVLPDTTKAGAASRAEALRKKIAELDLSEIRLPKQTVSVGVATCPDDAVERIALVAAADRALYAAKRIGRNRVVSFNADLGAGGAAEVESGAEISRLLALGRTIDERAAKFVYQPIVTTETGGIFAYEALCRPLLTEFPHAGALFDTAEHAGRVPELGRALRAVAVEPLPRLGEPMLLFLNIHPLELSHRLVEEATTALLSCAGRVVFEITEASAIGDYAHVRDLIATLQGAGFRVALDDLGAGYAGLNSLAQLEPDFVKLDMALVRGIERDGRSARLIRHILDFCEGEDILVVAEGVETANERRVVVELGCPLLQGYYFAKPGPPFVDVAPLSAWLSGAPRGSR